MIDMMHHSAHVERKEITPAEEEYLEAIFTCTNGSDQVVRTGELANQLHVKAPSVVQMLEKLKKKAGLLWASHWSEADQEGARTGC